MSNPMSSLSLNGGTLNMWFSGKQPVKGDPHTNTHMHAHQQTPCVGFKPWKARAKDPQKTEMLFPGTLRRP